MHVRRKKLTNKDKKWAKEKGHELPKEDGCCCMGLCHSDSAATSRKGKDALAPCDGASIVSQAGSRHMLEKHMSFSKTSVPHDCTRGSWRTLVVDCDDNREVVKPTGS